MKLRKLCILAITLISFTVEAHDLHFVDGDSMADGSRRIRLDGIDAPEFIQTCEDETGAAYPCGHESLKYADELIAGKNVDCHCRDEQDKYKRYICECFADGVSLNREMVASGWARAYRDDKYVAAENQARAEKLGIWRGKHMRPALFRVLSRYENHEDKN